MSETDTHRLENLFCFAKDVLGYDKLTELHVSWLNALLNHRFLLLLAPPKHFKSTVCTTIYPLFRLTEDHNMRILLVNETLDNAKLFLGDIKTHLLNNPRFRKRYGEWNVLADAWTEERILIPRTEFRKEPSIAVASVLGTVVSVHPNLIICDDPCSNRNTLTPAPRQKIINWFQRDLLPRLDHGGQLIVVMTRWHQDDLAGWIMGNPGFKDWKVINLAAEWKDDNGHHILFPEMFKKEDLEAEKARLGTANYNCLYLSDPSGQEGADFKASWIDSGRYDKVPELPAIYAGVDPAISQRDDSSDFAYCVVAKDKVGTFYVVDGFRGKINFVQQLSAIKRIHRLHEPSLIMIETNAYQAAFAQTILKDEETQALPIVEEKTKQDKHARIRSLAPLFERGQIRLPRHNESWVQDLETQLLQFPHGKDDMLDALYMAIKCVHKQKHAPSIRFASDLGWDERNLHGGVWARTRGRTL